MNIRTGAVLTWLALCLAPVFPASAEEPGRERPGKPAEVMAMLARITTQPRYTHSTWGYSLIDRATGSSLLDQAGDKFFVPGSILKVFSAAAVLEAYGPEYRFRTKVYQTGALHRGTLRNALVLVASGDLSLGLRERPDGSLAYNNAPEFDHTYANTGLPGPALINGAPLAGLDRLAAQVKAAGIREILGNVVIDDRLFTPLSWPDGLISPIWVNENRIDITITPTESGRPAIIDWRPKTGAYSVESRVETVAQGENTTITVDAPKSGIFHVWGQIAEDRGPVLRVGEFPDPSAFARTAFIEALRRADIRVYAHATGPNPVHLLPPPGAYRDDRRVAEQVSAPLSEFIKLILKASHSPGADLMICLTAVKTGSRQCENGFERVSEMLTRHGVPGDSAFIFDGAGSDEHNRITPKAMTAFLRAIDGPPYGAALKQGLPVLGVDGTLAGHSGLSSAGRVLAKSGSRAWGIQDDHILVTGVALAGYATARSGREMVFAMMVRDVPILSPMDIMAIEADQATILTVIQQLY
ncbi:MAG: D-alanyl-D-alanine carboxypeptidase/D-alanyl-D-alanine endopeptidase [Gammaproteobacteria bacterium]